MAQQIVLSTGYSTAFDLVSQSIRQKEREIAQRGQSISEAEASEWKIELENDLLRGAAETIQKTDAEILKLKADQRFKQWAVELESRWQVHKTSQRQQWLRYFHAAFTTVLTFSAEEELWRKEMRRRMDAKFVELGGARVVQSITEARKEEIFSEMFKEFLLAVKAAHRPTAGSVHDQVREEYRKHASISGELNLEEFGKPEAIRTWESGQSLFEIVKSFLASWYSYFFPRESDRKTIDTALTELAKAIHRQLESCRLASSSVILEAITTTNDHLTQLGALGQSVQLKQAAHTMVCSILIQRLQAIQTTWDAEHSLYAKMKAARETTFLPYFHNIFSGKIGKELLLGIYVDTFRKNTCDAFLRFCTEKGKGLIRSEPYIGDFRKLMAHVDLEILNLLQQHTPAERSRAIPEILARLRQPKPHLEKVQIRLAAQKLTGSLATWWASFLDLLRTIFTTASTLAAQVTVHPTEKFMTEVRTQLFESFPVLGKAIVPYSAVYQACDTEDSAIFASLFAEMASQYPVLARRETDVLAEDVARAVLTALRDEPGVLENASLRPRCGEPCPICKCPCEKAANHSDKHHTCHQPGAFGSFHYSKSRRLDPLHCPHNVASNAKFKDHTMSESRPYKEFTSQYPNWQQPVPSQPLKLREYLMWNFNQAIADYYGYLPADDTPASYNHSLEGIEAELKSFCERL